MIANQIGRRGNPLPSQSTSIQQQQLQDSQHQSRKLQSYPQDPHEEAGFGSRVPNYQTRSLLSSVSWIKWILVIFLLGIVYLGGLVYLLKQENKMLATQVENLLPFKISSAPPDQHAFRRHHPNLTFGYPTVGIPVAGNTFNFTKVQDKDLVAFDEEVNRLLKPYNDTDCELARIGGNYDGGYIICNNYLAQAQAILNLGINDVDEFGCEVTSTHPIPNYQYDCTTTKIPTCSTNNNANDFSLICVGDKTEKTAEYTFYTLWDLLKSRNLQNKHIILKMDTEGGEYLAFRYFPTQLLDYIDQIVMQVHFDEIDPEVWGNLDIFRTLTDKFVNVNYHMNNYGCYNKERKPLRRVPSMAFEVALVNKKLIKLHSDSRSFKQNSLNMPNSANITDCQVQS